MNNKIDVVDFSIGVAMYGTVITVIGVLFTILLLNNNFISDEECNTYVENIVLITIIIVLIVVMVAYSYTAIRKMIVKNKGEK